MTSRDHRNASSREITLPSESLLDCDSLLFQLIAMFELESLVRL